MKLSPLDIYNKEFKKSMFGYNVNQVADFLDEVGMAYERLLKEVNSLQDENEKLKEGLANYENLNEDLKKVMVTIQEMAKEQTRQARKEAEMIIHRAEFKSEQMSKETEQSLQKEYKSLQELKESKDLFKIRFKTLLESHLEMLKKDDLENQLEEDIAASQLDLDE